ncbi:MAG: hypothetical protein KAS02_02940 [Candidatus Pacebacteria bacterium]|nr:hypothetical protein [Candidatus Paceibacterota bacterium]
MRIENIRKISYLNWLPSVLKWIEALERVQREEPFLSIDGFDGLKIAEACGYCEEFSPCSCGCPLYLKNRNLFGKNKLTKIPVCVTYCSQTHFWLFIDEMQKNKPDFGRAKYHCKVILGAILEDCPDREEAVEDGIVFNF